MAYPYIFSSSFDTGDSSEWDSESDTGSLLNVRHYSYLAAIPSAALPYRGAYCVEINCGDANDHVVIEGDIDIANGATRHSRFAFYIHPNFASTVDDNFSIYELQQAGGTQEFVVGVRITASTDVCNLWVGISDTPETQGGGAIEKGKWHVIEVAANVDTAAATGQCIVYMDGAEQVRLATTVQNGAAVGRGVLGTQNTLATTTGFLYFDEFAFDDTRLGITHRWSRHRLLTRSSFVFVGSGSIDNVKILDGGSGDCAVELYDTDVYSSSLTPIWRDRTSVNNAPVDSADVPVDSFSRGCLAILSGTNPGAIIEIASASGWGSDGAIRTHASKRTEKAI